MGSPASLMITPVLIVTPLVCFYQLRVRLKITSRFSGLKTNGSIVS
jgi:hypothetical protein